VADGNALGAPQQTLSAMPSVTTLSLNDNHIDNLEAYLTIVRDVFPNLTYLSLLK
jgi:hypothetical protein